jgi:hypothetical protein
MERINRHFQVHRPTTVHIDEYTADIPLSPEGSVVPGEVHTADRVKQP